MKRHILLLIVSACLLFVMCACSAPEGDNPPPNMPATEPASEYVLVRSATAREPEVEAVLAFQSAVKSSFGRELKIVTDNALRREFEIIIGDTARAESKGASEGLGPNDYLIKRTGKKIIITSGRGDYLPDALDYVMAELFNKDEALNLFSLPDGKEIVVRNDLEYVIVESETASETEREAVLKLKDAINTAFGRDLKLISDDIPARELEIIVGDTKRAEYAGVKDSLNVNDYLIKRVGDDIIITSGSDEALTGAIDYVIVNLLDKDAELNIFTLAADAEIIIRNEVTPTSISVEGNDISTFKIYAKNADMAVPVLNYFASLLGVTLEVTSNAPGPKESGYIIIDPTELIENKYAIRIENGNITIHGSYNSIKTATEYFCGEYFKSFYRKNINLRPADSIEGYREKKELYTKEELLTVLALAYESDSFIVAQMTNCGYSRTLPSHTLKTFYEATGQYPGMLGLDASIVGMQLADEELDSHLRCVDETKKFLTKEQHSQLICEIIDYCADGGIVNFSSHFVNPTEAYYNGLSAPYRGTMGNKTSKAEYEQAFRDIITEGHEYNTIFKEELDMNARLFKVLQDNGVQVLFRPFQEMNASWFWWHVIQDKTPLEETKTHVWIDPECFVNLWRYVYDYYTDTLGLDNLIWIYSPNYTKTDKLSGEMTAIMDCYPGDEYVDIVGVDWYTNGDRANEIDYGGCYTNLANQSGKPASICEFGPTGSILSSKKDEQINLYNAKDQLEDFTELLKKGYKFLYVMNWNGHWSIPHMGYGREYMESPYTLSREDVKELFDSLKG